MIRHSMRGVWRPDLWTGDRVLIEHEAGLQHAGEAIGDQSRLEPGVARVGTRAYIVES